MAKRKNMVRYRLSDQIESILNETDNPAIINDVVDTEIGVLPNSFNARDEDTLNNFEETIVKNSIDGKTWNSIKE